MTRDDLLQMRDVAHQCLQVRASDWVMVYVAPQLEFILGYSRGELESKPLEILIPSHQRTIHTKHVEDYRKNPTTRAMGFSGEAKPLDVKARLKDGTERPVTIGLAPQFKEGTLYITCSILFRVD